ncbi:hypothetical protein [Mesorhizobium sp. WSM3860]|uniref:hypothetical protein n=1 Tax=Mesorhizobium sp. WSM3860 TaxID=2029403 RepID=UPI000BAF1BA0|nr:hypothetical protein [Mesorhizobium sp. WSM3860]PBC00783.1 hypothetical protein CK220_29435 [Mesorhizobium sp. WSM3860]
MPNGLSIGGEVAIDAIIIRIVDGRTGLSTPGITIPIRSRRRRKKAKDKMDIIWAWQRCA